MPLNNGTAQYINTGAWSRQPHYAVIDSGRIELRKWEKSVRLW
jgi:hypothetical protein